MASSEPAKSPKSLRVAAVSLALPILNSTDCIHSQKTVNGSFIADCLFLRAKTGASCEQESWATEFLKNHSAPSPRLANPTQTSTTRRSPSVAPNTPSPRNLFGGRLVERHPNQRATPQPQEPRTKYLATNPGSLPASRRCHSAIPESSLAQIQAASPEPSTAWGSVLG